MATKKPTKSARRRKVIIDLDKLSLPGPGAAAAWELPERRLGDDEREALVELAQLGLNEQDMAALQARLNDWRSTRFIYGQWPTLGPDLEVLAKIAGTAYVLTCLLEGASPRAQAYIWQAWTSAGVDAACQRRLTAAIELFAAAIDARREKLLGHQDQRRAHSEIVRIVAEIAGQRLDAPGTRPESTFYRACAAAFVLSGTKTRSPDQAIRRFMSG